MEEYTKFEFTSLLSNGVRQCFPNCMPRTICRCAASLFKVLYVDTNFPPKSRKCCHEVMVNNRCKPRVALQITAREIMTSFW